MLAIAASFASDSRRLAAEPLPATVHVFYDQMIHFEPDAPELDATPAVAAEDNGRVVVRSLRLPEHETPVRITAEVRVRPIPKDAESVHDKWDRAANMRLRRAGRPDIELVKFITAYGGVTEHRVDVTHLAPVLSGDCTFVGFVDTWMSPGWTLDLSLLFEPVDESDVPTWVESVAFFEGLTAELLAGGPASAEIEVPPGLERIDLYYLTSGHCTDGRGADEFVSKDNVITVDDHEVYRFKPWRADCERFRAVNPYTRRWSDGTWSSDYSRSGWCPSDAVEPVVVELTQQLAPGPHMFTFNIEDVRPKDDEGHYGYWRVSAYLVGW